MNLSLSGQSRDAEGRHRAAHPGLGPRIGARVVSAGRPTLRPGPFNVSQQTVTEQTPSAGTWLAAGRQPAPTSRAAHNVEIRAYCLLPNHVHLIAVPQTSDGLTRAISEVHRRYTRMVNVREGCRGHLWQGRFASSKVREPTPGRVKSGVPGTQRRGMIRIAYRALNLPEDRTRNHPP
jgi:hypothetical protein